MEYEQREEVIEELKEYVDLEGTEIGEACSLMCQLVSYSDYISPELVEALDKEIQEQLNMFKEHTTIVERVETYTRTICELEWD